MPVLAEEVTTLRALSSQVKANRTSPSLTLNNRDSNSSNNSNSKSLMKKKTMKMLIRKRNRARPLKKMTVKNLLTLKWPAEAPLTHKR
jgi:hypothetical protein